MIVLGVNFFDEEVKKWKKKAFIDAHKNVFFTNKEMAEREKLLGEIWDKAKAGKVK